MGRTRGGARGGQAVASRRRPPTALAIVDRQAEAGADLAARSRATSTRRRSRLQLGFLTVLTGARSPEDYWDAARRRDRAGPQHRPAAGPGGLDHRRRARGRGAAGPRDRQPGLAAPLRRGAGPHGRATSASAASGRRIPSCWNGWPHEFVAGRLAAQAAAPADPARARPTRRGRRSTRTARRSRPGQSPALAAPAAAAGGRGPARRDAGRRAAR